jgi:hypothetical protein
MLVPIARQVTDDGAMSPLPFDRARLRAVYGVFMVLAHLLGGVPVQTATAAANFGRQRRRVHC